MIVLGLSYPCAFALIVSLKFEVVFQMFPVVVVSQELVMTVVAIVSQLVVVSVVFIRGRGRVMVSEVFLLGGAWWCLKYCWWCWCWRSRALVVINQLETGYVITPFS